MNQLIFASDERRLARPTSTRIPTLLYGSMPPEPGTGAIGGPIMKEVSRLGLVADETAFDFMTLALAVTAGDTFADRAQAADGWARHIELHVPLSNPDPWYTAVPLLEEALGFLSGDLWRIEIADGGQEPPEPKKKDVISTLDHDCVALFSGGLDSTIGALDLVAEGRRPVLVSHAYSGDKAVQASVHARLPGRLSQFAPSAYPRASTGRARDVQMRTRSLNFLAFGALVGATMVRYGITNAPVDLHVPENGLIALNPPLTARRTGALSTRTTHHHYLELVQAILDTVGIPVRINNRYRHQTKGEMIAGCKNPSILRRVAFDTVSCGKWKRSWTQCGKCVPCIIRRASFEAGGMRDRTPYGQYADLGATLASGKGHDDVLAMILAARSLQTANMAQWIAKTGPLPLDRSQRDPLIQVAIRGLAEVHSFLHNQGLLT